MVTRWERLRENAGWSGVLRTLLAGSAVVGFAVGGPIARADLWPLPIGAVLGSLAPWFLRERLVARPETTQRAHRVVGIVMVGALAFGRDLLKSAPPAAQGAALGVLAAYLSLYVLLRSDPGPQAPTSAPTSTEAEARGADDYAFPDQPLDALAERLGAALGVPLLLQQSPMDGPWYTSVSLASPLELPEGPTLSLRSEHPNWDYGGQPPRDPARPLVATIEGPADARRALGARLLAAGLGAVRL
jgi:hypothetical protein